MSQSQSPGSRHGLHGEQPLDPSQGTPPQRRQSPSSHPLEAASASVPASPGELIARQRRAERAEKDNRHRSDTVRRVLELIRRLDTEAWEDQQIALAILKHLERHHSQLPDDPHGGAGINQGRMICWAIDADRLMHSRRLLESVDLA